MRDKRESGGRGGQDGRGGRGGGRSLTMINGVDVSDLTRKFTSDEWNILGSNGVWVYVTQVQECINRRGCGG